MIKKTSLTIAALALLLPTFVISAQESKSSFSDFKQEFMPQVGKKITVEGTLESAKLGWLVSFKGWGIYIHANRSADIAKMNLLNKFSENEVSVTGTLQYFPEPKVPPGDLHVAVAPEHFFFDVAEAKVIATQKAARIKETTQKPIVVSAAPAECLTVFRQFFSYVQQSEPSIVRDEHAQIKWLSKNLREASIGNPYRINLNGRSIHMVIQRPSDYTEIHPQGDVSDSCRYFGTRNRISA